MKQQCHIAMIYLYWAVYAGGLIYSAWRSAWASGIVWLIAVPAVQWLYIRWFPRFSTALGYGRIADEPTIQAGAPRAKSVTIYTALGCPFCPLMEQRLEALQPGLGFSLRKVDVTLRPDLLASKGIRSVPAVEIGGRFLTGLVSSKELAEAIAE
jgi:glutaredoxin